MEKSVLIKEIVRFLRDELEIFAEGFPKPKGGGPHIRGIIPPHGTLLAIYVYDDEERDTQEARAWRKLAGQDGAICFISNDVKEILEILESRLFEDEAY